MPNSPDTHPNPTFAGEIASVVTLIRNAGGRCAVGVFVGGRTMALSWWARP
jgi:hypothetical protein